MRIGIITGEYPPMQGGVGAYTRIIAQNLVQQGHEVFILSTTQADESDKRITLDNHMRGWGARSLFKIRKWAKQNQLDIVNIQFETAAYQMSGFVHFIPDVLKIPVVTTFHDLYVPYLFPKAGKLRDKILMHLAKASEGVIATNTEDITRLQHLHSAKLIPIGSNILTELPPDFDRDVYRQKANIAPDDFLIGYFGFINHSKGVEILLEDVATIREHHHYPLKLVMIGGQTGTSDPSNVAYLKTIKECVQELGLQDHLHWTGFVDDQEVSAYLKACDIVALPFRDGASYRRGSLMATIHHGCAIITTEPTVNIPLFEDGVNMLLCPSHHLAKNTPKFSHITPQLLTLYRDAELRVKLQQGAKALSKHFDWHNITNEYIAFFEEILGVST